MNQHPQPAAGWVMVASIAVFLVAMVLRVPSCYESFWVDELHSAWTAWDSLQDVFPRAQLGNQSPFYFVGLWVWKQIVGGGEVALRLSSVIAVAAAAAVITAEISRQGRSVAAGLAGGLVLATEQNALFFGTELRPYAWVILCAAIAVVCFVRLCTTCSRQAAPLAWATLVASVLLAVLFQPTSIVVLACFPATLFALWIWRDRGSLFRFSLMDALLLLGTAAVGFCLWRYSLQQSWQQRSSWASFATATEWQQFWHAWNWKLLILLPLVVTAFAALIAWRRSRWEQLRAGAAITLTLSAIAALATLAYWMLSFFEIAPLWHRRYFIAVLPIFAAVTGMAVGTLRSSIEAMPGSAAVTLFAAALVAVTLPLDQGVLQRLPQYPVALVYRGEDWRSALSWVDNRVQPNDLMFVDAGLIEAEHWWQRPTVAGATKSGLWISPAESRYLTYVARGPYQIDQPVKPLHTRRMPVPWRVIRLPQSQGRSVYVVVRQPASQIKHVLGEGDRLMSFGSVSVVVQSASPPPSS